MYLQTLIIDNFIVTSFHASFITIVLRINIFIKDI